jgi:hypothetical protein
MNLCLGTCTTKMTMPLQLDRARSNQTKGFCFP